MSDPTEGATVLHTRLARLATLVFGRQIRMMGSTHLGAEYRVVNKGGDTHDKPTSVSGRSREPDHLALSGLRTN